MIVALIFITYFSFHLGAAYHSLPDFRIINGEKTSQRNFPFLASLMYKKEHNCGASILDQRTLITTAHCVKDENVSNYLVRVGSTASNQDGLIYKIGNIQRHNLHSHFKDDGKSVYDVALIFTTTNIGFNRRIGPIALPERTNLVPYGLEGVIAGWGTINERVKKPTTNLRFVKIPIWDQERCLTTFGRYHISDIVFCAADDRKGKDACRGDSGGPFIYNGKLYGLISWGRGCGQKNKPGVYTNIIRMLDWIKSAWKFGLINVSG